MSYIVILISFQTFSSIYYGPAITKVNTITQNMDGTHGLVEKKELAELRMPFIAFYGKKILRTTL